MKSGHLLLIALILGACIALAGFFVGNGFFRGRATDRYVTVKGISERDVIADLALWPISFVAAGNDLGRAQAEIKSSHRQVMDFLSDHGIAADEAEVQRLEVTDVMANPYRSGQAEYRYIIEQTVMVRSEDPGKIALTSQAVGELVDAGVVLSSRGHPGGGPTYLFNRLSELKPEMIAEATANARRAAEQFAEDSGSKLGKIRRANQGVFQILARDRTPGVGEEGQKEKTVRVVSTVQYYLED
jgi:hypothetical protein